MLMLRRLTFIAALIAAAPLAAQDTHQHGDAGKFGVVAFATSCSADAQPIFIRAVTLLHSFEFGPAIEGFTAAAQKDPACGIASWGIALARWGNPFAAGIKPAAQLEPGAAAAERARGAGAKTERERAYIDAVTKLYENMSTLDQRTRMIAYRDAMKRVAATYADDPEASAFYALSLAASADPADKTYAAQLEAGAILEKLWQAQPEHPGLAHYIIHSYDVPPLASRAVDAARRYGRIAPDAPHALHMPSHTFTRLGYWQDSIDTNILSAEAARRNGSTAEELHALDYQTYAYLQTAQDTAARGVVDGLGGIEGRLGPGATGSAAPLVAAVFAVAAIPARYALERGMWADAARLEPRETRFLHADAITWFARALGAARAGDVATARAAVETLQRISDKLAAAHEVYWSEQVAIQVLGASAWVALAERRAPEAVRIMKSATEREDRTEKNAITPGPLAPARELLGDMLLQLKRPKEALAEFEKTLAKEPNRFRALSGAADAALASGDRATARRYAEQLLTMCARADTPGRPELARARTLVKRGS
jgi:tetratricopeptide (TPR) repeat protein